MPAKFERFLNRLLLIIITAAAISLAPRYDDPATAALYFLAAVAFGGLFTPIPTLRRDDERPRDGSR